MSLDELFAEAAREVGRIPDVEHAVSLDRVRRECARRSWDDIERARHAAFLDSLDLEQAAYELGRRCDQAGDLGEAARWYRVAARQDHGDAALRLGEVLGMLAERASRRADGEPSAAARTRARRDALHLVTEAAQAFAEAYAAGYPEAAELVEELLDLVDRGRPPSQDRGEVPAGRGCPDFPRWHGVLSEAEIQRLSSHAAQCVTCMKEFIARMRSAAATVPSGALPDPFARR
ncbi:hypothetical protein DZF91_00260 [Actinomadura logoneensis]|uniref:Sel1 repeat family protein n=1 Tax=Actinomadura logoneensis TaxID=2293572 RepID=A0A372JUI1_9ACTN|nr:hypothetical protein [Actinomadura logoneensis]RFU43609.1 hypothetical protein DZF91_00260 [Actinomadura logoneensis]